MSETRRAMSRYFWWAGWACFAVALLKWWLVADPEWVKQNDPVAFLFLAILCILAAIYFKPAPKYVTVVRPPSPETPTP